MEIYLPEQAGHVATEDIGGYGFNDEAIDFVNPAFADVPIRVVAGEHQDRDVLAVRNGAVPETAGEFEAAHLGHLDVADDEVDGNSRVLEPFHHLAAVECGEGYLSV